MREWCNSPPCMSSNLVFDGKIGIAALGILLNTTIAEAVADPLVESSEIFVLGGQSLRKTQKSPPPPA